MENKILAITGHTLSGKSTLSKKLIRDEGYILLPSYTTREKRVGVDSQHIHVTDEEFYDMVKKDKFIEWRKYFVKSPEGTRLVKYGTPKKLDLSKKYVCDLPFDAIESMGVEKFEIVYLDIDKTELIRRGLERGDYIDEIERRIRDDEGLMMKAKECANRIINNNKI